MSIELENTRVFKTTVVGGVANGIRIINFTGKLMTTIIVPRGFVDEAVELPENQLRGVYYLLSVKNGKISRLYAGQTSQGVKRLENHLSSKAWWDTAVMFLESENDFPKDVVDGLEAIMIRHARQYGTCKVDNENESRLKVSPYNKGHVREMFDEILWRMELFGYSFSNGTGVVDDLVVSPEDTNAKHPPFNFEEFGIAKGAILEFYDAANGIAHPEITAKVWSAKRIRYRGQSTTVSLAAKKILKRKSPPRGVEYWTYNGRRLVDIYREKYPATRG